MLSALQAPLVRIILRYGVGALVSAAIAYGLVTPETGATFLADPQVEAIVAGAVAAVIGVLTELAYGRAKERGGPT